MIVRYAIALALIAAGDVVWAGVTPELTPKLEGIFWTRDKVADWGILEAQYLQLAEQYHGDADQGAILAKIALTFEQKASNFHQKAAQYAVQALKHELDPKTAKAMYGALADDAARSASSEGEKRRLRTEYALKALRITLDTLHIESPATPRIPTMHQIRCNMDEPSCREQQAKARREERDQISQIREIDEQNRLLEEKSREVRAFQAWYTDSEADLKDIRAKAADALGPKHSATVGEIVENVKLASKQRRESASAPSKRQHPEGPRSSIKARSKAKSAQQ